MCYCGCPWERGVVTQYCARPKGEDCYLEREEEPEEEELENEDYEESYASDDD